MPITDREETTGSGEEEQPSQINRINRYKFLNTIKQNYNVKHDCITSLLKYHQGFIGARSDISPLKINPRYSPQMHHNYHSPVYFF